MRYALTPAKFGRHRIHTCEAFTLVEMSIVLMIVGLFLAGWIGYYSVYIKQRDLSLAKDNSKLIASDLSYFRVLQDRYPCPAPLNRPRSAFEFGHSFANTCTQSEIEAGTCNPQDMLCDPLVAGLDPAAINPSHPWECSNGICLALGARDANGDGLMNDPVMIGAFPVRDMAREVESRSLSTPRGIGDEAKRNSIEGYEQDSTDPWGDQYLYAVTLNLVRSDTFKFYQGAIGVVDEFGQPTAGINNDGHFVILSHGPNHRGGYSLETGLQPVPCGLDTEAKDNENCDMDAVFVQALGNYDADTPAFYDDIIRVGGPEKTIIWDRIPDPVTGNPTENLRNMNTGNVGVGMIAETESTGTLRSPTEKLDVSGTIRSPGASRSEGLCDHDGDLCFPITSITENGFKCGTNKVMKSIKGGGSLGANLQAVCVTPSFAPLVPRTCGTGKWVTGIRTNGTIICTGE